MNWLVGFLTSNIGRKLVMALTGLFLISFLLVHVSGNLLLLRNDDGFAFNIYSHFMSTNGVIRVLEVVLLLGFLIHIITSLYLTRRNQAARPKGYAAGNKTPNVSWASKNMGLTGSLILVFLILHIRTFWYEYHYNEVPRVFYLTEGVEGNATDGNTIVTKVNYTDYSKSHQKLPEGLTADDVYKDMYHIALDAFSSPLYLVFYTLAFLILAFHLAHGFGSAFRTLGLEHKKYTPFVNGLGNVLAVIVPLAFAIIPFFVYRAASTNKAFNQARHIEKPHTPEQEITKK